MDYEVYLDTRAGPIGRQKFESLTCLFPREPRYAGHRIEVSVAAENR